MAQRALREVAEQPETITGGRKGGCGEPADPLPIGSSPRQLQLLLQLPGDGNGTGKFQGAGPTAWPAKQHCQGPRDAGELPQHRRRHSWRDDSQAPLPS
jgi:hypothetical protein